jgi:hypothetical protein
VANGAGSAGAVEERTAHEHDVEPHAPRLI